MAPLALLPSRPPELLLMPDPRDIEPADPRSDLPPVRCPVCRKPPAPRGDKSPFPFCSERCKLIDLGRWFDGAYQIPVEAEDLDESKIDPIDEA